MTIKKEDGPSLGRACFGVRELRAATPRSTQCAWSGGFTPPVGSGLGGGTKLPEVGGVLARPP
ncbi:MAG TPA: hypothetical protein VGC79_31635 [Polyangiaceae bacterium]